ncbi:MULTISPECIES: hypothetical protein [unclassified Lysobacter]|uniref:hypothetical protein n=1 Tax=unclassified Lysobacter TaxID=2635362 RepID=UPI0006F3F271|nr:MULTISPECIES: hypothetical protein [unclassified Lysobacter]KRA81755.1 hypothetical protein ASD78_00285 [Lysobacter sp. Root667]KRC34663.1 hypothetical protein ASE10_08130 [Lysobacter sp. Root76]KRD70352.1 hypothetical protein ASE45_00295 [Lysobacter sp. Root96]
MNRFVLTAAFVLIACASQQAMAKNIIIAGERGTKWCCPDGVKSDKCQQFPSGVPLKKECRLNIAVAPDTNLNPGQTPTDGHREMTLKPVAEDSPAPVRGKDAPK